MKKTILTSSISVICANIFFLSIAHLHTVDIIGGGTAFFILICIALAALPVYFFITEYDENYDACAWTAVITEALIIGIGYLILKSTDDWSVLIYYYAGIFSIVSLIPMVLHKLRMARKNEK